MAHRGVAIDDETALLSQMMQRLRNVEDAQRTRLLPPNYSFTVTEAGQLRVVNDVTGATATLV